MMMMQNNLARVVPQAPARASATDLRRELHWLPIEECVKFKIATLTFKAKLPLLALNRLPADENFAIIRHWTSLPATHIL